MHAHTGISECMQLAEDVPPRVGSPCSGAVAVLIDKHGAQEHQVVAGMCAGAMASFFFLQECVRVPWPVFFFCRNVCGCHGQFFCVQECVLVPWPRHRRMHAHQRSMGTLHV
jgi:hypothetical protein